MHASPVDVEVLARVVSTLSQRQDKVVRLVLVAILVGAVGGISNVSIFFRTEQNHFCFGFKYLLLRQYLTSVLVVVPSRGRLISVSFLVMASTPASTPLNLVSDLTCVFPLFQNNNKPIL